MAKQSSKKQSVGVPVSNSNTKSVLIGAGVVLAALLIIAVVLAKPWGDKKDDLADAAPFQSSQISGDALIKPAQDGKDDQAVGKTAPSVIGKSFTGQEMKIEPNDKPKVVMFFAHWCVHCQAELPKISKFLNDSNGQYKNVEFISVATGTSPVKPNFPPAPWFKKEKYPYPVMTDDKESSIGNAYGLTSYPYLVFLDKQNKVISRSTGELQAGQFESLVKQAAESK